MTTWDGKIVTLSEITARLKTEAAPAEARHKQVLGVLNAVRAAQGNFAGVGHSLAERRADMKRRACCLSPGKRPSRIANQPPSGK